MATISSSLRLQDQFSGVMEKSINMTLRMADAIESMNSAGDSINLGDDFASVRQEASLAQHAIDQFNDELNRTDQQAAAVQNLGSGFGFLSKAVVVANQGLELIQKAWNGIDKLGTTSDARIGADARLGNILDDLRTQEQLEQQVMQAANASRGEYAATAELIARVGRQDYFKGNNDAAIAFAETLNKGLVVSGASTMEASSALIQLSQGIASGVLRGQEFNSIMENGSVIAEMMATSLGVTKGQLREMAEDEKLTTDVIVASIMAQAGTINEQFAKMPTTYGQAMNTMANRSSDWMDSLSQPGMAIDVIISSIESMVAWASTADGTQFFSGMANAVTAVVSGIAALAVGAADVYLFFSDNWSQIEPILWGVATAVGGLTLAYSIYKGVLFFTDVIEKIHAAGQAITTASIISTTMAQWGLNTALLACPLTWIIVAIMAVVGALVCLTLFIMDAWQTNIDWKVGIIQQWNQVLAFFDRVPLFFQNIGYGIADGFSYSKVIVMQILEDLVNGAIEHINKLIEFANQIPGISINTIGAVSFGAETAIEEEVKRAERAAKLADTEANVAAKSAMREHQLTQDANRWRAEAEANEQAEQQLNPATGGTQDYTQFDPPPMTIAGGKLDSIGSPVDISDQSLQYLNDIAEIQLLESLETTSELQLSKEDASLMQQSAVAADTNVYYIQYTGGVKINNDVRQGESWDAIRQKLENELQQEMDTSISGIEEVLYSG